MNKRDTSTVVMVGRVPLKRAARTLHEELLRILSRARLSRYRPRDFTCGYGAGTFGRTAARAQVRAAATGHREVVLSSSCRRRSNNGSVPDLVNDQLPKTHD